jgi:hypothetical protein
VVICTRLRLPDSLPMAIVIALIRAAANIATRKSPLPAVVAATRRAAIRGQTRRRGVKDSW